MALLEPGTVRVVESRDLDGMRDVVGLVREYVQEWYVPGAQFSDADQALLASLPQMCVWPDGSALLARIAGSPVGCVLIAPSEDPSAGELRKLFVRAQARGQGLGTALLTAAYEVADDLSLDRLSLTVHPDRTRAISLYVRDGFTDQGPGLDGFVTMVRSTR